jgi:hypothetical protein
VPLFVEEVTRLLLERGEQSGVHLIPPTLQQSLMARQRRPGLHRPCKSLEVYRPEIRQLEEPSKKPSGALGDYDGVGFSETLQASR